MEAASQRKTIEVKKGLFLIRYVAAEDKDRPPVVKIAPQAATEKNVTLILHPNHLEPVLWQPGSAMAVLATGPATLSVEVTSPHPDGSTAASVRIEELTQGTSGSTLDLADFQVLGHVAGTGDVIVALDEWIAGPSAPARIEGIEIEWPSKPRDLDIRYSVKLAKPHASSGQMLGLGSFAGTRGRALPMIGLILEMFGPKASGCQFVVDAAFVGSPVRRLTGRRIAVAGPTELEPLVGLRIAVEEIATPAPPGPVQPPANRVRVFRGRPKQDQTADTEAE